MDENQLAEAIPALSDADIHEWCATACIFFRCDDRGWSLADDTPPAVRAVAQTLAETEGGLGQAYQQLHLLSLSPLFARVRKGLSDQLNALLG